MLALEHHMSMPASNAYAMSEHLTETSRSSFCDSCEREVARREHDASLLESVT
jgi:hypothetical protein